MTFQSLQWYEFSPLPATLLDRTVYSDQSSGEEWRKVKVRVTETFIDYF